jgi:predicted Zn-dependent protease with MMP-like domain
MERQRFFRMVREVLDSLPEEFRSRLHNVAVLVEDLPPQASSRKRPHKPAALPHPQRLVLGVFHGVPLTRKSVFDLPTGPDYIVLYQKNIEEVCSDEDEMREQIQRTVIHELGHYFGMNEGQLEDV